MSKSLAYQVISELNNLNEDQTSTDVLWSDDWYGKYEEVYSEVLNTSRWYERVLNVYRFSDYSFLGVERNQGLTEIQDGTPENVLAYEVEPYSVEITKYARVYRGEE
jgi:hypothetical protein